MTIKEMIEKKKALGYSNQYISDMTGVPLGTVQKIFSGETTSPRYKTLQALKQMFSEDSNLVGESSAYNIGMTAHDMTGKTMEDYLALPEGTRIEMIDGVFYDMAAPTFIHQKIGLMIAIAFDDYISKNKGNCITSVAPTDVQLDSDDKTMVQPDVLVVCNRDKIIKARVVGAPDLIVEVLSPSNWYMDIVRKKDKYQRAGVREYWIVLPEQKRVLVYVFEKEADYKEYTFDDKIPVAIWKNECKVDFKSIYEKISFLYD